MRWRLPALALALTLSGCGGAAPGPAPPEDARRVAVRRFWDLFHEATTLRSGGDFTGAAARYEQALALDPRHEDSLYYLGRCREETGDAALALEVYRQLVEVEPHSARGHLALGALSAAARNGLPADLARAEVHLRRAHEINGEETGSMVRLGEVLIVLERPAEAREWLEAAVKTNPKSVEGAFLAGYLRWREGEHVEAGEMYRRAARAARTDAPVRGVLSEGDRKAQPAAGPQRLVAPPLEEPHGKTLFGAYSRHLKETTVAADGEPATEAVDLDRVYAPLEAFAAELARVARGSGAAAGTSSPATHSP